ncbi:hypothetical protein D8674_022051 [Pyrus ussuriensis x Pyrus communis]|uniref:Uncharacterized protein n=1 Tax=Pyrus ussuriensis x Pyrus communis TaxID=2448454 RepID=A0A5N5GKY8_9ROSA|nr:hypothetical protein D8674_022051 [Pyrus ussuriensis x Pyrus communis]
MKLKRDDEKFLPLGVSTSRSEGDDNDSLGWYMRRIWRRSIELQAVKGFAVVFVQRAQYREKKSSSRLIGSGVYNTTSLSLSAVDGTVVRGLPLDFFHFLAEIGVIGTAFVAGFHGVTRLDLALVGGLVLG